MFTNHYKNLFAVILVCLSLQSCANAPQAGNNANKNTQNANSDLKSQASDAFAKGDYINAYAAYEKLLVTEPQNKDYLFYFAESLRMSGNTGRALDQYNIILAGDPDNLAASEGRALCFLQHGDISLALTELEKVTQKDPSRWRALNAIGVTYSIAGQDDEAVKYYNQALSVSNNNPSVINNIALGVAFAGDGEKGADLLKNTLATMPESEKKKTLENNLALIYGISGKMEEAESILRKNLPEAAVYNNLGFYAKLSSDKKLAWSYLSKAISSNPVYYVKAENNMQGLDSFSSDDSQVMIPSVQQMHANPAVNNENLGNSENNPGNVEGSQDLPAPKFASLKVWRGKYKLPLPTLRPEVPVN